MKIRSKGWGGGNILIAVSRMLIWPVFVPSSLYTCRLSPANRERRESRCQTPLSGGILSARALIFNMPDTTSSVGEESGDPHTHQMVILSQWNRRVLSIFPLVWEPRVINIELCRAKN